MDVVGLLPVEVAAYVISFLPVHEVGRTLPLVSRSWQQLAEADAVWHAFWVRHMDDLRQRRLFDTGDETAHDRYKARLARVVTHPFNAVRYAPRRTQAQEGEEEGDEGGLPTQQPQQRHQTAKEVTDMTVIVWGKAGAGKASLTQTMRGLFFGGPAPRNGDCQLACTINYCPVLLNIMSVASGCHKFTTRNGPVPIMQTAKESSAFMFVYSVVDKSSFDFIYRSHWALVKRIKNGEPFSAILVGNKSDVDVNSVMERRKRRVREVSSEEGVELARQMSAELGRQVLFLETSAKLDSNVTTAFAGLAYQELQRRGQIVSDADAQPAPRRLYDYCVLW